MCFTNTVSYKIIINQFQFNFFLTIKNDCANCGPLKANTWNLDIHECLILHVMHCWKYDVRFQNFQSPLDLELNQSILKNNFKMGYLGPSQCTFKFFKVQFKGT